MKNPNYLKTVLFHVALAAALIAGSGVLASGQAFTPARVATIVTASFDDPKAGVTRLVKAYAALDLEFKPKQNDLDAINTQLEKLAKEIGVLQTSLTNPAIDQNAQRALIDAKNDEGARLQVEFKRKQEDAKAAYEKRSKVVIDPIIAEVSKALEAYAKKLGIDIVIDLSKTEGVYLYNLSSDITKAFVADYNSKPVTP